MGSEGTGSSRALRELSATAGPAAEQLTLKQRMVARLDDACDESLDREARNCWASLPMYGHQRAALKRQLAQYVRDRVREIESWHDDMNHLVPQDAELPAQVLQAQNTLLRFGYLKKLLDYALKEEDELNAVWPSLKRGECPGRHGLIYEVLVDCDKMIKEYWQVLSGYIGSDKLVMGHLFPNYPEGREKLLLGYGRVARSQFINFDYKLDVVPQLPTPMMANAEMQPVQLHAVGNAPPLSPAPDHNPDADYMDAGDITATVTLTRGGTKKKGNR